MPKYTRILPLTLALFALATLNFNEHPVASAPTALEAGYAEADITPPLGTSMPGYFGDRKATGVLDPLKAKVLYLRQGEERVALVACDLIGMGAPLVRRIREEVRLRMDPAPTAVWVHATHTHTGGQVRDDTTITSDARKLYPGLFPGVPDPNWIESLVRKTADAVVRAAENARPETALTLHQGMEPNVAHYRRFLMRDGRVRTNPGRGNPQIVRPAGEIDPRVHTLRFGGNRIMAVVYGLHPDCVGGTRFSADYPGQLTAALQRSEGRDWRVLYFNAACGNINHVDVNNPSQKGGPDEARRIGETLAGAVRASLSQGTPLAVDRLDARRTTVECRLRRPSEAEVAEAEERLRTNRDPFAFNGLFAPAALVLARTRDTVHRAEISTLRLGDFGLAAVPGEYFVELAREIESGSPLRTTRTIGLTNGSMGYIPTRRGYEEGGYEAGYRSARYEPENGHRWAAAAIRLLQETDRRRASSDNWRHEVSEAGKAFLERRRQSPPFGAQSFDLAGLRAGMGARQEPTVPGVRLTKVRVGEVPCEWVTTPGADPDVRLLYLHGGGWVSGSGGNYLPLAAEISLAAKCAVLMADYRLAPEHPFPAGLDDCVSAHDWMVAHGPSGLGAARATFVAGDSAGGNLTLATLLALKERKLPLPAGAVAISPGTDFTLSSQSLKTVYDPIISARTMPEFRDRYLPKTDPRNPLASPVFGDFRGLPPILIQTGAHEMLRDDSIRVAKKARADGVPVALEIWPGMVHVFQIRGLPESREAVQRIGDFIRRQARLPRPRR